MQKIKAFVEKVRNYVTYDRILFLVIIIFILRLNSCQVREKNEELEVAKQEAKIWKDKYDNEHATVAQVSLEKDEMKDKVDSIAEVLKIKPKVITRYLQGSFIVDTQLIATVDTIIVTDTVEGKPVLTKAYPLNYVDSPYLEIHAIVPQNPQKVSISLAAKLSVTEYYKQKKFLGIGFGKKTYYADIGTDNKYIKFTNAESFKLKDQEKWRIKPGFGVGLNYDFKTGQVKPGIQAGLFLIRSR